MRDPNAWEALLDRSINAFYEGEFAEGRLACDQLLCLPDLPHHVRAVTRTNQVHYAQQLQHLVPSYREAAIALPMAVDSTLSNPTMTTEGADWLVLYTISGPSAPPKGSTGDATGEVEVPTDCMLTRVNADLHVVAAPVRVVGAACVPGSSGSAPGHASYRHIARVGDMWVAAQATAPANAEAPGELALLEFVPGDPSFRSERPLFVMHARAMPCWMPVTRPASISLVDLHGATSALEIDPSPSALTLTAFHDAPYVMNTLSGVSQWVNLDDGFICLAQDAVVWDDGEQTRLYRAVRCDDTFRITHVSHPFRVHESATEVAGLAILDGVVAFTFVIEGRALHIATVDIADFTALLQPVPVVAPMGPFAFPMPDGLLAVLERWAPASAPDPGDVRVDALPVLRPETIIERLQSDDAAITPAPVQDPGRTMLQEPPTGGHAGRSEVYDEDFYAFLDETSHTSAQAVVPFVMELVRPRSVVDLGCGTGVWLAAFAEHGVKDILGVDGSWVPGHRLQIPQDTFTPHDLCRPLHLGRRFDLAVSLETAEHLAPECATTLVASLVRLAPVVVFSAAVPGQGGTDHRNLQWPRYWSELFAEYGFVTIDAIRPLICRRHDVAHWYVQNTFLFVDRLHAARDEILRAQYAAYGGAPFPWIHQDYWDGNAESVAREIRQVRATLYTPPDLPLP